MTAPDPGLTDLIAAHRWDDRRGICECMYSPEFGPGTRYEWMGVKAWAAHVALVVEQHTKGRIAELEERIANAQSLCNATGRYNAARQKHWNIRVFACDVLAALKGRAALEGEQQ